ncbi:MAG: STAS/SEC14 domain-containing protein [Acidobacteria bacterium]|nr:STAS/SEC14 domain-containing protein [Acidobacteriota bacterium]MCW5970658.1 hypothetical protein [Blastocatellales bacterium]
MGSTSDHISAEQIKAAVSSLSLPELEQVFDHLLALKAERRTIHLPSQESALLTRINSTLPMNLRERFSALKAKREDDSITDDEYLELTQLNDRAEELHAARMAALVELAELRGVNLPMLMTQLGVATLSHD